MNQPLSARIPSYIGHGVMSTGAIVVTAQEAFILDFYNNTGIHPTIVSRVVIPHQAMPQLVDTLKRNRKTYEDRFGEIQTPQLKEQEGSSTANQETDETSEEQNQQGDKNDHKQDQKPSAQDIYDELKLSDDMLCGQYSNAFLISHAETSFKIDFLTTHLPRQAVSARVFFPNQQLPRLIDSLENAWKNLLVLRNQK